MALKQPVFRSLEFLEGLSLTLDQPIPENVKPYLISVGTNQWKVQPNIFKNAESIIVVVGPTGNVQSMEFGYDPATNYQDLVNRYIEGLGDPTGTSKNGSQQTTWDDGATRFTLFSQGTNPNSRVGATLVDA